MSPSRALLTAGLLGLLVALAACGKRGGTIPPEGTTFPRTYPAPRYVLPEAVDADAGVEPEPATLSTPPAEDLQFLPTERRRIQTRTFEPAPTPLPSTTPTPADPETPE
ncbi:MAG: hypothetical protein QNJ30_21815 [Kiloniellales bacterium]|nr:hypothetical protein [Kiloniellales bacterium]